MSIIGLIFFVVAGIFSIIADVVGTVFLVLAAVAVGIINWVSELGIDWWMWIALVVLIFFWKPIWTFFSGEHLFF